MKSQQDQGNEHPFPFDAESWSKLSALFEESVRLSPEERKRYIDRACAEEPALRTELETLLSASDATTPSNRTNDSILASLSAVSQAASLKIGQRIAHYEIVEKLGSGGMGLVYKARDLKLNRLAALKFLPVHLGNDERTRTRFLQEARAASAIDHPNICTVYEIGELEGGPIYLAMAYYDGQTLKRRIHKGTLSAREAIDIAVQVAEGLRQAHAHGIVHRDIKPANLMVTMTGLVKILDFGVAKSADMNLTQPGSTVGTIAYMSPEQAQSEDIDHRTDIWSLGVVLYEMLTGKRPFRGDHSHAITYNILNRTPEPVTGLRAGIPLQLSQIVHKLLAKPIEERYQNLDALIEDLRSIQHRDAAREFAEQSGMVTDDSLLAGAVGENARENRKETPKILFVDDEPELELLMRRMLRKHVREHNWVLEFASNGQEALEKLALHADTALVMTDINMPVMDGLTLLGHVQEINRPIKTVVVSAYSDMKNIRAAMNRGAFDFVIKPIDLDDLEMTIHKSLDAWRAALRALQVERELISLQKELAVARQIQQAIQPPAFPDRSNLSLYAFTAPAHEISGTFYDHFEIDEDRTGFLMGDVGGKGISATLFMTIVQTHLKSMGRRGVDPGECVTSVNRLLVPDGFPDISVQVFLGIVNARDHTLRYCNAGHPSPFSLRGGGLISPVPQSPDHPVWTVQDHVYQTHSMNLRKGEGLLLFTRGLIRAKNDGGHAFSLERLAMLLRERHEAAPAEIIRHIIRALMQFIEDAPLDEDATVLGVRLN